MSQALHSLQIEYDRLIAERQGADGIMGGALLDDASAGFGDAGAIFAHHDLGGDGTMAGYEFLEAMPASDMMTGLYLQHDGSTYPPV
jgi:hypothetical protein